MRFAAVIRQKRQKQKHAPARSPQPNRQPVPDDLTGEGAQPTKPQPQEVPADLDQRVRLAGEW